MPAAEADSVLGPWRRLPPRFDFDGGHAMPFRTLQGERMIALHSPNKNNFAREIFLKY